LSCNSTATTRAPARTKGEVIAPKPAPTSSTRSPRWTCAPSTRRHAHSSVSRWNPHRFGLAPGTAHHHHGHGSQDG
jgi:hypothetical protein